MENELQALLDAAPMYGEVKIKGEVRLNMPQSRSFYVGKSFSKNLIQITRPNLTLDGSGGILRLDLTDAVEYDINVLFVSGLAKNVEIKNLKLYVYVASPACAHRIAGICNTAYGLKLTNCHIELISEQHIPLTGIFNNGNLDTHMETRADNLVVDNCTVKAKVSGGESAPCETYGIYNNLANSISVQNTFVYSENVGSGETERAVGVFTNGRFGRFVGNNIKANGTHNIGKEKEHAHAYGFVNEGLYTLVNANNIVGEWAVSA